MVIMDVLIMATRPMVWIKIEHSGLFCPICLHIYFLSPHTIWARTLQQISLSDISIFLNKHLPMNEFTIHEYEVNVPKARVGWLGPIGRDRMTICDGCCSHIHHVKMRI